MVVMQLMYVFQIYKKFFIINMDKRMSIMEGEEVEESKKEVAEESETEIKKEPEVTPEEKIVIRSYPAISTLLFILGIISTIFGIAELITSNDTVARALGVVFVLLFVFLSIIVAFEFPETKFFLIIAMIIIVALLYVLLSHLGYIPSSGGLGFVFENVNVVLTSHAYLGIGLGSIFVLFLIWLSRRFSYWVIEPNQVTRKSGLLGKVVRYPTAGMRYSIDIRDVLEYLLFFRCGTLVLEFPSEKKTFVLPMVPNIKKVEKKIERILGYVEVE